VTDELTKREGLSQQRRMRLKELLDAAPANDLNKVLEEAAEMRSLLLADIAERIAGPVNRHLATMPRRNYADKSHLCSWVNATLSALNLCVQDEHTGKRGILVTDPGSNPARGYFQLRESAGNRRTRTVMSRAELPVLTFAERLPLANDGRRLRDEDETRSR
jgi:hypothetical protein